MHHTHTMHAYIHTSKYEVLFLTKNAPMMEHVSAPNLEMVTKMKTCPMAPDSPNSSSTGPVEYTIWIAGKIVFDEDRRGLSKRGVHVGDIVLSRIILVHGI